MGPIYTRHVLWWSFLRTRSQSCHARKLLFLDRIWINHERHRHDRMVPSEWYRLCLRSVEHWLLNTYDRRNSEYQWRRAAKLQCKHQVDDVCDEATPRHRWLSSRLLDPPWRSYANELCLQERKIDFSIPSSQKCMVSLARLNWKSCRRRARQSWTSSPDSIRGTRTVDVDRLVLCWLSPAC